VIGFENIVSSMMCKFQNIFDEILKKKMKLENVKERSDAVCQRSTDPRVTNNMMQLSAKYQGLVSQAKVFLASF
jgi:hypothetical protein